MFLLIYSDLLVKLASGNSSDSVPLNTIGSSKRINYKILSASDFIFQFLNTNILIKKT